MGQGPIKAVQEVWATPRSAIEIFRDSEKPEITTSTHTESSFVDSLLSPGLLLQQREEMMALSSFRYLNEDPPPKSLLLSEGAETNLRGLI